MGSFHFGNWMMELHSCHVYGGKGVKTPKLIHQEVEQTFSHYSWSFELLLKVIVGNKMTHSLMCLLQMTSMESHGILRQTCLVVRKPNQSVDLFSNQLVIIIIIIIIKNLAARDCEELHSPF